MEKRYIALGAGLAGLFLLFSSAFIVRQTEQALVLQFGKPEAVYREPGLKFKIPFLQNVVYFDKRLLEFDSDDAQEVTARDQKRLIVDAFIRYRITDPLKFYQTVNNEANMRARLKSILEASLADVIGKVPLNALLSDQRVAIMRDIKMAVSRQAMGQVVQPNPVAAPLVKEPVRGFGIEIVDVRIRRADLPQANSQAVFKRMTTELQKQAADIRARGDEEAQKIRARAEKERTILLANAREKAQEIRGEGDSTAAKISADAFGRDPEFFKFYRSLQAYREALGKKDTTLILSPNSEFLKGLNFERE